MELSDSISTVRFPFYSCCFAAAIFLSSERKKPIASNLTALCITECPLCGKNAGKRTETTRVETLELTVIRCALRAPLFGDSTCVAVRKKPQVKNLF